VDSRCVGRAFSGIKLLATGKEDVQKGLVIEVARTSAAAKSAIEENGGKVKEIYRNKLGLRALLKPESFEKKVTGFRSQDFNMHALSRYMRSPSILSPLHGHLSVYPCAHHYYVIILNFPYSYYSPLFSHPSPCVGQAAAYTRACSSSSVQILWKPTFYVV
jgi:hypothetical protein